LIGSALFWMACGTAWAQQLEGQPASIVRQIQAASERQEMTVNTSRILTLSPTLTSANRIPRAQVNNPDILSVTPLSATQIQISAKKPGVTQVNLWDETGQIYTVDVIVYGDAQELSLILENEFPNASLRVAPLSNSVMISGYVDQPNDISAIIQIAEQYYPKVINLIDVGGVHQVLLHVKVMEISRTKLRNLGFDWASISGSSILSSGPTGLLSDFVENQFLTPPGNVFRTPNPNSTFAFGVVNANDAFFGVLEALRQDNLMKILSEPTIVCASGRPSKFHVGGTFTVIAEGLAGGQIKDIAYGTTLDVVPIVLGNGRLRLEVRPEVSEIDNSVNVDGVPGRRNRSVDTGVEMMAGQTMVIGGLLQTRVDSQRRGIPWICDLPYVGAAFRRVHEENNEVELLIAVTPELVDAMDAEEVPLCGPGMRTTSPTDVQLGLRGHIEVPRCCPQGAPGTAPGEPGPIMPHGQIMPPGAIVPPEQMLTPTLSEPLEPLPSAPVPSEKGASSDRPKSQNRSKQEPTSPEAAGSATASDLPGFLGPVGYEATK
jgi:pilus assembly protein CpaC